MAQSDNQGIEHLASIRDTAESVAIAIVLAFVLRAFVVEAFVIPTGSMAPRLMGQHWQYDCPACGHHFAHGIGREQDTDEPLRGPPASCPNCHLRRQYGAARPYSGDRVLVLKYFYRFREPQAWDVVVFKNPQDNDQNYIKRLIGLPGEAIEIVHGDVFVSRSEDVNGDRVIDEKDFFDFNRDGAVDARDLDRNGDGRIDRSDFGDRADALGIQGPISREAFDANRDGAITVEDLYCPDLSRPDLRGLLQLREWSILRKRPKTQKVMWQIVFDNDHQPDPASYRELDLGGTSWVSPWRPAAGWKQVRDGGRVFEFEGSAAPQRMDFSPPRAWFCPNYAYNNDKTTEKGYQDATDVNYDLRLSAMFVPKGRDARLGLHLSSFPGVDDFQHHFRAWVRADGQCVLEHRAGPEGGTWKRLDEAKVALAAKKGHNVALEHVERRATLWVDGKAVLQTTGAQYSDDKHEILRAVATGTGPQHNTALPAPRAALLGSGGPFELHHIRVQRDVFYTNAPLWRHEQQVPGQQGYGTDGRPIILRRFLDRPDMDEFFVLGDNSPASKDSRMWGSHALTLREEPEYRDGTVPRYNMIGRAFFVYWPGGFRLPLIQQLPIVPNVGRMRLIR